MDDHRFIFARVLGAGLLACSSGNVPAQKSSPSAPFEDLDSEAMEVAGTERDASSQFSIDTAAKAQVIREMARQLGTVYVFSSAGAELERALLTRLAEGAYEPITDARELARSLTSDLRAVVQDKHLGVEAFAPGAPNIEHGPAQTPSGVRRVEVLPGNVGYLELESLPPLERSRAAIAGAFALLQSTEALIIDNRNNHGGDPGTVAYYVSYLSAAPPFVVSRIRFRDDRRIDELRTTDLGERSYGADRPVFVLDSASTFSGGEDLGYSLQALKRAIIVGEITGGGAHPTLAVPLGYGLVGRVPFARSENPITESNWEGVGVIPDVAVPAERSVSEAERLARAAIAERRARLATAADAPLGMIRARAESPLPARAPNPIVNGDFSRGLEPWGITTWSGPLADGPHPHRLEGGKLCFSIEPKERILVGWPPETSSYAAALEKGQRYQLSFKASASGPLPIAAEVTVGHRLPPYTAITTAEVPLDSSFRYFTVDVEPEEHDDQAGLCFKLAAIGEAGEAEVCIDDVALIAQ